MLCVAVEVSKLRTAGITGSAKVIIICQKIQKNPCFVLMLPDALQ